jgi:hypothetical protein
MPKHTAVLDGQAPRRDVDVQLLWGNNRTIALHNGHKDTHKARDLILGTGQVVRTTRATMTAPKVVHWRLFKGAVLRANDRHPLARVPVLNRRVVVSISVDGSGVGLKGRRGGSDLGCGRAGGGIKDGVPTPTRESSAGRAALALVKVIARKDGEVAVLTAGYNDLCCVGRVNGAVVGKTVAVRFSRCYQEIFLCEALFGAADNISAGRA